MDEIGILKCKLEAAIQDLKSAAEDESCPLPCEFCKYSKEQNKCKKCRWWNDGNSGNSLWEWRGVL